MDLPTSGANGSRRSTTATPGFNFQLQFVMLSHGRTSGGPHSLTRFY